MGRETYAMLAFISGVILGFMWGYVLYGGI